MREGKREGEVKQWWRIFTKDYKEKRAHVEAYGKHHGVGE
jgi:hypothetical protein